MTHHTTRTITAMFDTRAEAERAAESLRGLGIAPDAVRLRGEETQASTSEPRQERGFLASLADLFVPDNDRAAYGEGLRRGATLLTAEVDETRAESAMDALEAAGAVDLDAREADWRSEGWAVPGAVDQHGTPVGGTVGQGVGASLGSAHARTEPSTGAAPLATSGQDSEERIRLAEERLRVGKRETHGGRVRVRSYVVETPVEETVHLREERVHVERTAVDREATAGDAELFRERVIEAEESIEEPVVAKDVRVTGEVVVNKTVTDRAETVRDTVRRTEVDVDEDAAKTSTRRPD